MSASSLDLLTLLTLTTLLIRVALALLGDLTVQIVDAVDPVLDAPNARLSLFNEFIRKELSHVDDTTRVGQTGVFVSHGKRVISIRGSKREARFRAHDGPGRARRRGFDRLLGRRRGRGQTEFGQHATAATALLLMLLRLLLLLLLLGLVVASREGPFSARERAELRDVSID